MPLRKPSEFLKSPKKHFELCIILLLLTLLLTGCGPVVAQEIARVTPLPAAMQEPVQPATTVESTEVTAAKATPEATPTPLNVQLPQGSAAAIALATDVAMQPEIDAPIEFAESPVPITFDEFYNGFDIRKGLTLSQKLLSLDGKEVVMEGYMAPPLKAELDWFVLTEVRLGFCPFCSSDADWPTDIAVIYLTDSNMLSTQAPVRVQGRMEIGSSIDPETGMVSIVRIYASEITIL